MEPLLSKPVADFDWKKNVSQHFGVNHKVYKKNFGTPGHNALDIVQFGEKLGYGTVLLAQHDFESVSFQSDFPSRSRGTGLWLKGKLPEPFILDGKEAHYIETIHWHITDILIDVQTRNLGGKRGDMVALMGNTGFVFPRPNNRCDICPYLGTHDHNGVRFYDKYGAIIVSPLVPEYKGYRDPVPFMYTLGDKFKFTFNADLFLGKRHDQIAFLQTILKIEGFAKDYDPTGYFGSKTMRDVIALQKKYGIAPAFGYVGVKTRRFLLSKYT